MNVIHQTLQETVDRLDVEALASTYRQYDMLSIPQFLPDHFIREHFVPEVDGCSEYIHRVNVPAFKKSGSVSRSNLGRYAPNLFEVYTSNAMKQLIEKLVGESLFCCPEWDQHGVALYYYTEPGDRIKVHYDKSFYKGKRFTVLLGMVQDSTHSKLICYPGASKKNMKKNPTEVPTNPGDLVIFNGDKLWHEVTPLGQSERRAILTLEFITNQHISFLNKWTTNVKDRFLYFGKSQIHA